ncbi:MAG: 50S ribosomal protein L32 [Geminicoccaceae bacterium]
MAVPRKKISKSKRDMRRAHDRLATVNLAECSNCGEPKLPHHVCDTCGYYNGREVITQTSTSDEAAA